MKKIYISLPITGHEESVYRRESKAILDLQKHGYTPISPLEENHISIEELKTHAQKEQNAEYLGNDIKTLLLCDGILMCDGWKNSKGCNLEYQCAKIYGLTIIYYEDLIKNDNIKDLFE